MKRPTIDTYLLSAFFLLMLMGIIMVYSASAFYAERFFNDHLHFLKRHLLWLLIGLGAMGVAHSFPFRKLRGYTWLPLLGSLLLLIYTAFIERGRWINWGWIHFQVVDVAKFSLILFFADSLSRKERGLQKFAEGLFPHLFYLFLFAALVLRQPDFSSAVMLVLIGYVMLFVAPVRVSHLALTGLALFPPMALVAILSPYKFQRLLAFFKPEADLQGIGYQVYQSLVSLGRGGMFGVGFAGSTQKMFFLPEAHTDFIFAIIGEEWGFWGTMFVVGLFGVILWRGVLIARYARDRFGFYLAVGATAHLVLYAMINIMVTLRLVPATGLPLPFISYGGTALLFACIYAGILLRLSREAGAEAGVRHSPDVLRTFYYLTGGKRARRRKR